MVVLALLFSDGSVESSSMNNEVEIIHRDPDVYRIVVPFEGPGVNGTNCYVVVDEGEALVVDSGAPGDVQFEAMDGALDALGVDRSKASFFLTHFHTDHSGLLDRIAPPESTVYVNARDVEHMVRLLSEEYRNELFERLRTEGVPSDELELFRRHIVTLTSFDPGKHRVVEVSEGDEVVCGRWHFRVLETPGHTVGHQSLLEPDSGVLFGGDAILFAISPSVDFSLHGSDGLQRYLDSLDKLISSSARLLCHSHGEILDGWRDRAEWVKRHRIKRLDDAFSAVAAERGSTGYAAVRRIRWNVPFDSWEEISLTQRWCIIGEGLGYLDHLVFLGQARREMGADGLFRYYAEGKGVLEPGSVPSVEGRTVCCL